jgi:hypothetical protein
MVMPKMMRQGMRQVMTTAQADGRLQQALRMMRAQVKLHSIRHQVWPRQQVLSCVTNAQSHATRTSAPSIASSCSCQHHMVKMVARLAEHLICIAATTCVDVDAYGEARYIPIQH